jgi:hypothetical protein
LGAPVVSAIYVAVWPSFLVFVQGQASALINWWNIRTAIRTMEKFIVRQKQRLADQKLPKETRKMIEENIAQTQRAIASKDFQTVSQFMNEP